ncbi:HTH-type transcriptional repressor NsrR [Planctomycetes bacterium Pan216]|uniref:HTH-type transcriptional repressor NsrR n=1 Tax=Kolteria novifilia TaxID=2527975 RepID=A0A518B7D6_9BACT|nr:HTH-type transcriptional repressor NsrR [Planctomycetes bacterium Pan216]
MKLNLFTDYALRCLMYLCWHTGRTVTAEEIATYFGISHDHIVKVIQELSRQGYVQARRGRGGGSILARDPKSIPIAEVINTFEGPPALLDCLRSTGVCAIEVDCRLKRVLGESQRRMMEYLATVTVDDIAGEQAPQAIIPTIGRSNNSNNSNNVRKVGS